MPIEINTRFDFILPGPTDVLLQFEAAAVAGQRIVECHTSISPEGEVRRVSGHDGIGQRLWLRDAGRVEIAYRATVEITRPVPDLAALPQIAPHRLPGEVVEYLFDSRYCPSERFHDFVEDEFGRWHGGARIAAICDWMAAHFTYEPGSSTATTTALDSFAERRGICRDYAHTLITLARASAIPARYVSAYAPGVEPPDFHAVAEVFLADPSARGGGTWRLVDATGMAMPGDIVTIGVGRDAADVSFLTSFGPSEFGEKQVTVIHREGAAAKTLVTSPPG